MHYCILYSVLPADLPEVVGPRQGRAPRQGRVCCAAPAAPGFETAVSRTSQRV